MIPITRRLPYYQTSPAFIGTDSGRPPCNSSEEFRASLLCTWILCLRRSSRSTQSRALLPQITALALYGCPYIDDLAPVTDMRLTELILHDSTVRDLMPLASCRSL